MRALLVTLCLAVHSHVWLAKAFSAFPSHTRLSVVGSQAPFSRSVLRSSLNDKIDVEVNDDIGSQSNNIHVVLTGLGDLRGNDHCGLGAAIKASSGNEDAKIFVVCHVTDSMLAEFPGAVCHTFDTAHLIAEAIQEVDVGLREQFAHQNSACHLHVTQDETSLQSFCDNICKDDNRRSGNPAICFHVCDLGPADNSLQYGVYNAAENFAATRNDVKLCVWNQDLREKPWSDVRSTGAKTIFPDNYETYEKDYSSAQVEQDQTSSNEINKASLSSVPAFTLKQEMEKWTSSAILQRLEKSCKFADENTEKRIAAEKSSGLFATHWGGLPATSVGCRAVLRTLKTYLQDCQSDDLLWSQHPDYVDRSCRRNGKSLEHAAMSWQLRGTGESPTGNLQNWMAGETMIRYLAAPLLLGTVSPRRIWKMASESRQPSLVESLFMGVKNNALQDLVEAREWHRLLAARNILHDPAYQGQGETTYKYWRYHGFLCRYAITNMAPKDTEQQKGKEGILLVHGFGASGSQWNKAAKVLSDRTEEHGASQVLAPDLIGFGQSEKPALSYTGYMWDAYTMDFVKEKAIHKHGWKSFVVGGNSIGGFTSVSLAACDTASVGSRAVTSTGAPGTGVCSGLVLMNSAGPIQTREEVNKIIATATNELQLESVAQVTGLDALPPCKPPARPLSRIFGNVLLGYLRPRVPSICKNLYPTNPAAVDDELCEGILRDSLDPGAIYVMMAGAKLPPPRSANELLQADFGSLASSGLDGEGRVVESAFTGPVLISQGVLDPLNDAKDRMNRFGSLRKGITMDPIQAGHCPHDELPDAVASSISGWMSRTRAERMVSESSPTTVGTNC